MADSQRIAADLERSIVDGGNPIKNKHARDLFQSIRDAHGEEAAQDMMDAVIVHNKQNEKSEPEDKIRSFFSDIHNSDHVESIKSSVSDNYGNLDGPITFLNSYYNSDSFKNKILYKEDFPTNHEEDYKKEMEYINQGIDHYKPYVIQSGFPMIGSAATHYPDHIGEIRSIHKQFRGMDDDQRPDMDVSTIFSLPQAKRLGANLYREVIPHEYTHNTRGLTDKEEEDILWLSRNPNEAFEKYKKNKTLAEQAYNIKNRGKDPEDKKRYDVSSEIFEQTDHDFSPNEKYADLNALRFMMHLQGIYDVRKGEDMKMEDLNKALQDKSIKDSFIMKRMLKNFTPENIVKFNNKIAFQRNKNKDDSTA